MLAKASGGADAGCCRDAVLFLHRELGRNENALGCAAWTMRHGERGEWRTVLRDAASETLREARRAASEYNRDRLRRAVGCYMRLAACPYGEVAELMLRSNERVGAPRRRRGQPTEHVSAQVRFVGELPASNGRRRRGRGRGANYGRRAAATV